MRRSKSISTCRRLTYGRRRANFPVGMEVTRGLNDHGTVVRDLGDFVEVVTERQRSDAIGPRTFTVPCARGVLSAANLSAISFHCAPRSARPVECLEQFRLHFEQLDGVAAIDINEVLDRCRASTVGTGSGCDRLRGAPNSSAGKMIGWARVNRYPKYASRTSGRSAISAGVPPTTTRPFDSTYP
jgi:hypothetical protein